MHAVVGLGSNLGDRLALLREAVVRIEALPGARVIGRSRVYETAPVGGVEQGPFFNAAIALEWSSSARDLLRGLLSVEASLGRVRDVRWGPRTVDLDVLWIEGTIVDEVGLSVPHPRLVERAFALAPLLEVAPRATDPLSGARYVVPQDQVVRALELTL